MTEDHKILEDARTFQSEIKELVLGYLDAMMVTKGHAEETQAILEEFEGRKAEATNEDDIAICESVIEQAKAALELQASTHEQCQELLDRHTTFYNNLESCCHDMEGYIRSKY